MRSLGWPNQSFRPVRVVYERGLSSTNGTVPSYVAALPVSPICLALATAGDKLGTVSIGTCQVLGTRDSRVTLLVRCAYSSRNFSGLHLPKLGTYHFSVLNTDSASQTSIFAPRPSWSVVGITSFGR